MEKRLGWPRGPFGRWSQTCWKKLDCRRICPHKSYILIDFNNVSEEIKELFQMFLNDLDSFFGRLQTLTNTDLFNRESVIIFDEVQMFPQARAAIKYLVADGRYDYIETGSLVSINHNVKNIVIPSEEVRIDMFPMDFEEFCWASDKTRLYDFAEAQFRKSEPMGQAMHRKMLETLREYILVGGMPQSVLAYIETKDFRAADRVKRNILSLYRNDISKYAGRQAPKVTKVFDSIPQSLQKHEKRFSPSSIKKGLKMRNFDEAMFWLDESRVANFCYAATEPSVSLSLNQNDSKVKIYMADTGLLISMAFNETEMVSGLYERILHGKLEFNKGMIMENLVAQAFRASGHPLYFFSKYSEDAESRMKIDFLIRKNSLTSRHNILPIEVKSSQRYSTRSLDKFRNKYASCLGQSYILHTGDLKITQDAVYLPLYMAGML